MSFEGAGVTGTFPIPIQAGRSYRCFPVQKQTGPALRVEPQGGPITLPEGE